MAITPVGHDVGQINGEMAVWERARAVIGERRVALGPQASQQWLNAPEHLAMVLSRYRTAAALIGNADRVLEVGCGEGIGAILLSRGRSYYCGIDTDAEAINVARALVQPEQGARIEFLYEDALMLDYFHTVQSFGLQDTSIHLGHPDARHYLLMCGICPR
jgi:SAM-dependent methyltransferase